MENNEIYEKLSGVLRKFLGDAFTFDGKEGGLNMQKLHEAIKKERPIMNILLMGLLEWVKARLLTLYLVKK
ncbi:hypothetical protein BHU50_03130 [Helicobacter pylori]|uniref:Uncharacterized protein n=1 Tax=Helicobacter pylori TaxID=210 RepID=A0A0J8H2Q9_HELPX|nr:hypothetical protein AB991_07970 [Helicobacter pylori]OLQ58132.1 hypothetical protein BHU50_03130 [Helicobacter pylori]OLR46822.1 hypothetical protein BIZ48_04115 [Helicobacter pylori]WRB23621.1 hypothetical protein KVM25_03050 [Helicobacter pylori]